MKFSNFPILIPAFTAKIPIDNPLTITSELVNIPFLPHRGNLTSEPSYPYPLRATFIHGSDYLSRDRNGQHVKLSVQSTARDEITGALLRFAYSGVVTLSGETGKVIAGDKNATTTDFGNAFVDVKFETDNPDLEPIENKVYVGSGRFIVEKDEPIIVEYKISEVAAAPCGE
ncbi:hypothetical protein PT974_08941 [Cladobotryum mycophilum]|uniref:Uncharacterized protein n=1 Tax=Cladobotryum mycophilum TaxID=491253 RepID=A0ABR0SER5_9HYPO